jgi:carbamoyltransferase
MLRRLRNRRSRAALPALLKQAFPGQTIRAAVHRVEHHLAHLSSAFHVCPFDQAAVVSVDGFGDFSSAAWGAAARSDISPYGRVYFPHSLGIFYQAITQYLGFPHYGDEYKIMGLAPYGCPLDSMQKIVRLVPDGGFVLNLEFFRHHREDIPYQWMNGSPEFGDAPVSFSCVVNWAIQL